MVIAAVCGSCINFPAGDSWTHAWTVQLWLDGDGSYNNWASAKAYPQQWIGWLAHVGNTTEVDWSRLSVLTAIFTTLGALIAARLPALYFPEYKRLNDWSPLFAVVILSMSFTMKAGAGFMTDGYYFFLLCCALWLIPFIVRISKSLPNYTFLISCLIFAGTIASMQRSHGYLLMLFPALWIGMRFMYSKAKKIDLPASSSLHLAAAIGMIPISMFLLHVDIPDPARSSEVMTELKNFWTVKDSSYGELAKDRGLLIFGMLQHLGMVLLPVSIVARLQMWMEQRDTEGKNKVNWWYVGFGAVFMILTFHQWGVQERMFPFIPNSITPEGFGPRSDTLAVTEGSMMSEWIRTSLTLLGTGGGVVLIWLLSRTFTLKDIDWTSPRVLAAVIGLGHAGIVLLNPHFFDRYLLPLIPFLLIWLAPAIGRAKPQSRQGSWILVTLYFVFSMWGTIDYLDWTKSKWELTNEALDRGVPAEYIIAGYEVDGFYTFENDNYPEPGLPWHPLTGVVPWWVSRVGLPNMPVWVLVEDESNLRGTVYEGYVESDIRDDRMMFVVNPEYVE